MRLLNRGFVAVAFIMACPVAGSMPGMGAFLFLWFSVSRIFAVFAAGLVDDAAIMNAKVVNPK